jgi:PAS domain S-box-containing protein
MVCAKEQRADMSEREQFHMLKLAADHMDEAVTITTTEDSGEGLKIVYVNDAFTRLTGYDRNEVVGQTPKMLQGKRTERWVLNRLNRYLRSGQPFHGRTYNYRKDGSEFMMDWAVLTYRGPDRKKRFYLAVQEEATI